MRGVPMSDTIRLTFDKDCIGTLLRIETPDGKVVSRKEDNEYLDLGYLREFIGCEVIQVYAPKDNPSEGVRQDKLLRKLVNVEVDEGGSAKAGKTVYYLEFSDPYEENTPTEEVAPVEPPQATEVPNSPNPRAQKGPSMVDQLSDTNTFEWPLRDMLEKGDLVLLINAAVGQPISYARIEYIEACKTIGNKLVGILQLVPGSAQLIPAELPVECLKMKNPAGFKLPGAPFPMALSYFPLMKHRTIVSAPPPSSGMFRQGGRPNRPDMPPAGGLMR